MTDVIPIASGLLVDPVSMTVSSGNRLGVKSAYPRVISGTTGTLLASDNGNGVQCTNAAAVALTVPAGTTGFTSLVLLSGDATTFPLNVAGTGAFTTTGALTNASSSPSD